MKLVHYCLFVSAFLTCVHYIDAKKTVLCYFVAWAVRRPGQGKFAVKDADNEHCTHIVYAFMGIDERTSKIKSIDPSIDFLKNNGTGQLHELRRLRERNRNAKVLVSIGGYLESSTKFSPMAASSSKRAAFINSIVKFLRDYELDGLDICWQFPAQRGGLPEDKRNLVTLLEELKYLFKPEGWLLTVHILAKKFNIDTSFEVGSISKAVDFINLAAVEFHGPWDRTTGIISPLKSNDEHNVEYVVDYVIKRGAIRSKILLGMATYGHAYILAEAPRGNYIGTFSDQTFAGPWTRENGVIAYSELCTEMNKDPDAWKLIWDAASQTPVAFNNDKFVSYDDKRSLIEKAKLVEARSLGGAMLWSLDMDDFRGLCHGTKYPLLSAISGYLNRHSSSFENVGSNDTHTTTSRPAEWTTSHNTGHKKPSVVSHEFGD